MTTRSSWQWITVGKRSRVIGSYHWIASPPGSIIVAMLHNQGATFKTGGPMSLDQHARATAYVVFLTVLASLFCCGSTSAQEPERRGWNLAIAPYFWAAGISGDVGVRNVSTNVDESFSDICSTLPSAACCSPKRATTGSRSSLLHFTFASEIDPIP